jgi:hypothetical protein
MPGPSEAGQGVVLRFALTPSRDTIIGAEGAAGR